MLNVSVTRPRILWAQALASLWLLPALLTAAAVVLAFVMVALDRNEVLADHELWFVFGAGAEGARGVLSTIAGGIITVTGVVFSITIVVLQLASSQFTPRVLRSFTADRAVQLVLGVFIGTFTYALLVLRTVRSPLEELDAFVPSLAVTVAVVLALVSIAFLIYFISHISRSIQAEVIMDRVARDALEIIDTLFPEELGQPFDETANEHEIEAVFPDAPLVRVTSDQSGYLQAVDEDGMTTLAQQLDVVVRMEKRIGDFIVAGDELASLHGARLDESSLKRMRAAFTIGAERTRYQDVERGIIELTDIGVRALSPGTNDPTTALACTDRLTQIMTRLATRQFPPRTRADDHRQLRVIARRPSFADLVRLAYSQLRHHGGSQPTVAIGVAESLARVVAIAPPSRRPPLQEQLQHLFDRARREWQADPEFTHFEAVARRGLDSSS